MLDYPSLTDSELLELCRKGDELAENALVLRYRRVVRSGTRPFFLAGGDSEDLMQEGMIGLLSAIRNYDPVGAASFRTYAELCIRRRIISAAKAASRQKHAPLNDGVSLEEILSEENKSVSILLGQRPFDRSPEEQVLAREKESVFLDYYSQFLSAFEKEILKYYLEGLSYDEIENKCGRSRKSVDNAVQRIRKKLARHLSNGDFSN